MNKSRRGWAKVEFLACKQEIEQLLQQGYSITAIHRSLQEDGKISMSQPRFHSLVRYYKLSIASVKKLILGKDIELDYLKKSSVANKPTNVQSQNKPRNKQEIQSTTHEENKPLIEIERDPKKQKSFF